MNDVQQRKAAQEFAARWKDKGYEKGHSQPFWLSLLRDVYGIEHPEEYIIFEEQVHLDHTSFVDGHIDKTKVLIEQKSIDKDLRKPIRQSDGSFLTPFEQAKRYSSELPYSQRPRWIVTCNFKSFLVYDMERPHSEPEEILLENLPEESYRLNFLVNSADEHIQKEMQVSMQAGELVGKIYEALLKEYINPQNEASLKSLNMLCVRLVFCLYAEDADIFGHKTMFHDYLERFSSRDLRRALIDLFKVLDTKEADRDPYLDAELAAFPYVNGGLFADEEIEIPQFTDEIKYLLLQRASADFDWSKISPTIFGAVFESTLNPATRRSGGMHYTSIENIHKVIDPLFLDDLKNEFTLIKNEKVKRTRKLKLESFQNKLASLKFLDPACGSGNFLTETYLSLRRLENEVIRLLTGGEMFLGEFLNPIKVSISQFYGIEINDFAVSVAKTALWIAESQMMKETEDIVHLPLDFLPLKSFTNIHEGNALRMDWEQVVSKDELNYIIGNPPFVGYGLQTKEQKEDVLNIYLDKSGKPYKSAGKIDYVACWYYKAAQLMHHSHISTAFVSTNSITQGEQVIGVWKPLYDLFHVEIFFAWKTFKWNSESSKQAAVHCVIIGFNCLKNTNKYIYDFQKIYEANNISPYIIDMPTTFIESHSKPICNIPKMVTGNRPADGGHLIIEEQDYSDFITKEPKAKNYIKNLTGALEFINNKKRYCLWLVGISPSELRTMPEVLKRVEACKADRLNGAPDRQKLADTPWLFREQKNPISYIIIPRVSSENRKYIPLGFLDSTTIPTDSATIIENADLYHFGILTSNVHMAWMRTVAGRLKSDYRYSKDIVYNNFPWPNPTEKQKEKIKQTAQGILDARALYPESSLADLYDEAIMPIELRKAHRANDKAVMEAYGFWGKLNTESECVAELMKMYQARVEELNTHKEK